MKAAEIQKLRKDLGLSQKALAARIHVGVITVKRWECEEQRPSPHAIRQLARLTRKQ